MNRRHFLGQVPFRPDNPEPPGDLALIRVSRRAMATTFEIALPFGTPNAIEAAEDALDLIDQLEEQLTVFRDTSEVLRLNATAADGPVIVEEQLFELLAHAVALTKDTAGAFDCATGSLVKAWGFFKREGRVPTARELATARLASGMRHVILDPVAKTVKFRQHGLEINLGGIGKGYALDRAAELLWAKWGIRSALLHAGGSSVRALGVPLSQLRGWAVVVRHPWDDSRTLGTVWLANQGFGTSAATFQYFEYNGRKLGHLLDPRTGWPASGTASASVAAPTAAAADALSTAFFVLGATAAMDHCRSRPDLAAIVLPEDQADERPVVVGFSPLQYDR